MRVPALVLLALTAWACQRTPSAGSAVAPRGPVEEARALLEQGQLDAALAKLLTAPPNDPEALMLQGRVWAKKAETAPLPTPAEMGAPAPEFKGEEMRALDYFEKALAARPNMVDAQLGLADVLVPHAIRRYELHEAGRRAAGKRPVREGDADVASGPDYSVERILKLLHDAAASDANGKQAPDALLRFATRVHRVEDVDWALKELVRREPENPERLVQYGDFLAKERKDRHGAIDQYRQAMIWRPDDEGTRSKIADLYIEMGREHFDAGQWAAAETQFLEAEKFVADKNSPQGLKVREHLERLRAIRVQGGR